ncbi:MAG TPA: AAA family ATPase [Rhodanobacteraceae bacterium]|nr:AAA family ATPase [Rhodanobacteraceae bacterium]
MSAYAERMDAEESRDIAMIERVADERQRREHSRGFVETPRKVVTVTLRDLLTRELPPREMLLAPWLTSQSLTMIHAWRGTGKTHVALGIAYALASGGTFLNWTAEAPVPVLYLDGEMPGSVLKERLAAIVDAADKEAPEGMLRLVTPDLQPDGIMPDLGTREGQEAIEAELGDAQVIVVDNISCLVRAGGKENDAESWGGVATWALRQRAHGRAVVFIHHSGKGGQQRGTSKREDILDTVLALRRPPDYTGDQGARFEIHFEKARALYGKSVDPIEAVLDRDEHGKQAWAFKDASNALHERIIDMAELGLKKDAIAQELGCGRATVYRHLKDALDNGEVIPPKPRQRKRLTSHALGDET